MRSECFAEVLVLLEVLFEVLFFSFVTKEHQHRASPTPIDPLIDIDCNILPAAAIVHILAVAIVATANVALVIVSLAHSLSLSPSPP